MPNSRSRSRERGRFRNRHVHHFQDGEWHEVPTTTAEERRSRRKLWGSWKATERGRDSSARRADLRRTSASSASVSLFFQEGDKITLHPELVRLAGIDPDPHVERGRIPGVIGLLNGDGSCDVLLDMGHVLRGVSMHLLGRVGTAQTNRLNRYTSGVQDALELDDVDNPYRRAVFDRRKNRPYGPSLARYQTDAHR